MGVNIAPRACFIIGLISFISYFLIFLISLSCYYYAINRYTRRIFLLLSLSVLFQLPWYSNFILHRSPNGRIIYSFHMISSIFYFSSFSFVCFAWGDVLRTKNYELLFQYQRREQIRKALILSNIGFICLTIIIIYYCITSNSLEDFFQSKAHYVFAGFDVIKNILMGIFIAHFGHNLRSRLMNYYHGIVIRNNNQQNNNLNFGMATTATTTNTTSSPVLSGATLSSAASTLTRTTTTTSIPGASSSSSPQQMKKLAENTANLIRVNQKLIILVIISIFSFLLKALALIMWKRYTSPSEYEPPTPIEHRWVFWWIVFEIFPVALPALAFFFTMGWPSKLLTSFVILFPASIKNDPTVGGGGGGLGGDGGVGCGGESEYDEHGRTRSSEIEDSHHRHSHHRHPNNHYPKDDHTGGGGGGVIQITSSHMVSPLSKSLLRESYDEGGGDDDCFHVMNRLSTLSGELIDIELDRDTLTAENEGDEEEQKDSISQQHEETKSFTSSTSGRFQFRFPSISSRT